MCYAITTVSGAAYAKISSNATLYNNSGTAIGEIGEGTEVITTGDVSLGGAEIVWNGTMAYTDQEVLAAVTSASSNFGVCKIKSGVKVTDGPGSGAAVIDVIEDSWGILTGVSGSYYKVELGAFTGYVPKDKVTLSGTPNASSVDRLAAATLRMQIVGEVKRYIGVPYVWGGESPSGFDCSGLVQYVLKQFGIEIPRTAELQCEATTPVGITELLPGDLVFFCKNNYIHHVGMYIGSGQMIHAPYTGSSVKYQSLREGYYRDEFYRGGRVVF